MLSKAELYYFSPTGGTKKAGEIFPPAMICTAAFLHDGILMKN